MCSSILAFRRLIFLGGGWRDRCRRPNLEYKKTAPYPLMGQELHSCDTTQIDACASARYCVPSYASRWITGGHPSAPTYIRPDAFRPPSKVHSPYADPLHSHRRQLSDARFCKGTPLSQRFRWYFVVGAIIAAPQREVNRQFKRKKRGGRPIIFCMDPLPPARKPDGPGIPQGGSSVRPNRGSFHASRSQIQSFRIRHIVPNTRKAFPQKLSVFFHRRCPPFWSLS